MSLLLICSWICSDCLRWFDLSGYQMLSDRFYFTLCALKTWMLPIIRTLFPSQCHLNDLKIAFSTFFITQKTPDLITSSITVFGQRRLKNKPGLKAHVELHWCFVFPGSQVKSNYTHWCRFSYCVFFFTLLPCAAFWLQPVTMAIAISGSTLDK